MRSELHLVEVAGVLLWRVGGQEAGGAVVGQQAGRGEVVVWVGGQLATIQPFKYHFFLCIYVMSTGTRTHLFFVWTQPDWWHVLVPGVEHGEQVWPGTGAAVITPASPAASRAVVHRHSAGHYSVWVERTWKDNINTFVRSLVDWPPVHKEDFLDQLIYWSLPPVERQSESI